MNRTDQPGENEDAAEATTVNKQTSDTLMAGEKIMEALEIADADRKVMADYEQAISRLAPQEAANVVPPTKNPVLAAYELDGPMYVLKVVRQIHTTALNDALLVLPFSKVVSLMHYLNEWAIKVGYCHSDVMDYCSRLPPGTQRNTDIAHPVLPPQNPPQSDRGQQDYACGVGGSSDPPSKCVETGEGGDRIQPSRYAVYPSTT